MGPVEQRSRTLVEVIIPVAAGLVAWASYGFVEGVLVAVAAALLVLSHVARRRVREQLVYRRATDHAGHAPGACSANKSQD